MFVSNWALYGFTNLFLVLPEYIRSFSNQKEMRFLVHEFCNLKVRDQVGDLRKAERTMC